MTPRPTADPTIGDRIRVRRLRRGWSIRYAASRAGVSHATWSRIERGRQAADNRFTLAEIAGALECSPAELAGAPVPATDRAAAAAQAAVHGIRRALVDADLTEPAAGAAPPVAEPARTLALTDTLRQGCDYAGAARLLPELLGGLHAATSGPDREAALRLLCDATFIASSVLRNLGHPADAWLGAERCRDAADAAGDPVLRGYAASARASAAMYFGPTDVGIWRIGIEVDGGDPGLAAQIARGTNPAGITAGFRQVFYYADTARALARIRGREREAVRLLLTAERPAPQHVHTSAVARETTRALLERSLRTAAGSQLRGLCERMQVG
ncbi:helix-turn-helix transcriptional regulator [Couchioplanes caeruleus]|uniref:helix-turn-helix domain-containing protein n=1 Tax=Couchioplanes caeruleus TaxID=56438 RepID=UPI0020C14BFE|nr:helix-turn-helix transcriptional regulator [Couchioplanes caeruleus]UQU61716.1 helix-turn-helix transcriptional regulator [Couchioplanes caeruleus]